MGEYRLLNLLIDEHLVKMRVSEAGNFSDGDTVPILFDAESIHLFDSETGLRIDAS